MDNRNRFNRVCCLVTAMVWVSVVLAGQVRAQGIVDLGINPTTGLREIQIILPGLAENLTQLEMVLIPAGTFLMGSPSSEIGRHSDEGPQHQVTISKPFYMGKYEITQAQWAALMGPDPSIIRYIDNYPVESLNINMEDCDEFMNKLTRVSASGIFRLPTEAEWEYACRAGTTTRFYWGDDLNETEIFRYAWFMSNSGDGSHEVGLKLPNAWGLYDMSGNKLEWCLDAYAGYVPGPAIDPVVRGDEYSYYAWVVRGGAAGYSSNGCRSAARDYDYWGAGFRVIMTTGVSTWTATPVKTSTVIPTPTHTPVPTNTATPKPTNTPTRTPTPESPTLDMTPWHVFTFDSAEEFQRYPGGFIGAQAGNVSLKKITVNSNSFTDGQGVTISTSPGQVELMVFPTLDVGENVALIRLSIHSIGAGAAVGLGALDGSNDGSIGTNIPANSGIFADGYHRMVLLYDPPGTSIVPVFQVANLPGTEIVFIYIDNLEIFLIPEDANIPGRLLHGQ